MTKSRTMSNQERVIRSEKYLLAKKTHVGKFSKKSALKNDAIVVSDTMSERVSGFLHEKNKTK